MLDCQRFSFVSNERASADVIVLRFALLTPTPDPIAMDVETNNDKIIEEVRMFFVLKVHVFFFL